MLSSLMIALGYIIIGVICTLMTLAVIKAHKEAKQNQEIESFLERLIINKYFFAFIIADMILISAFVFAIVMVQIW